MLIELSITDNGRHYRWAKTDPQGRWLEPPRESDEEFLLKELASYGEPVKLIIPGDLVVTTRLTYEEKEKRHMRQLAPYQLEELVIGDVESLHFAIGPMANQEVTVAYLDEDLFSEIIETFKSAGITVSACYTDFQRIAVEEGQWAISLSNNLVLAHHSSGIGFRCPRGMAKLILGDFLAKDDENPEANVNIHLYADNEKGLEYLEQRLPEHTRSRISRHAQTPPLALTSPNLINLCQGQYGPGIAVSKIWKQWRSVIGLAAAATLAAFCVNIFEGYNLESQKQALNKDITQLYQQVAGANAPLPPNPVKRLEQLLGPESGNSEPSQSVYMLSKVAPLLKAENVDVSMLIYDHNKNELVISIETSESNNQVDAKLSKSIAEAGFKVEPKNAKIEDGKYKVRFSVTNGEES